MKTLCRWTALLAMALPLLSAFPASAWELSGSRQILLHTRDHQTRPLGSVEFQPLAGGGAQFEIKLDRSQLQDHFLSMHGFKCVDGPDEIFCHVPYPYPHPATVTASDLRWLEHSLLFLYKTPNEFGAKLWNGVYFQMQIGAHGIVGTPQSVDLNEISAPPDHPETPPYSPDRRTDIAPDTRWITQLTIE